MNKKQIESLAHSAEVIASKSPHFHRLKEKTGKLGMGVRAALKEAIVEYIPRLQSESIFHRMHVFCKMKKIRKNVMIDYLMGAWLQKHGTGDTGKATDFHHIFDILGKL